MQRPLQVHCARDGFVAQQEAQNAVHALRDTGGVVLLCGPIRLNGGRFNGGASSGVVFAATLCAACSTRSAEAFLSAGSGQDGA